MEKAGPGSVCQSRGEDDRQQCCTDRREKNQTLNCTRDIKLNILESKAESCEAYRQRVNGEVRCMRAENPDL